jgi:hypothetical protein
MSMLVWFGSLSFYWYLAVVQFCQLLPLVELWLWSFLCGVPDMSFLAGYCYLVILGTLVPFGTSEVRGLLSWFLWSSFGLAFVGSDLELFVRIMIYPHAIRPIIALMLCCHAVLLSRLNLFCWLVLACPPPLWNLCGFVQVPTGTSIWEVICIIWE